MRKKLSVVLVVAFLLTIVSFALALPIYSSDVQLMRALSIVSFSDFDVTSLSLLREYDILLKSRRFVPSPGISKIARLKIGSRFSERAHVLIQFKHIPNSIERKTLTDNGVRLLAYIPNKTWFASISTADPVDIAKLPFVRSVELVLPEDKISPHIRKSGVGPWATNHDGTVNLIVVFFGDVSEREAQRILRRYGTNIQGPGMLNDYTITAFGSVIQSFANEDAVQWIDEAPPPDADNSDGLRARIDVNNVQVAPYNLNGSGVVIGQWESYHPYNHTDLQHGFRKIADPDYTGQGRHATRVAGVFGGDGTLSGGTYRGVAPNVDWVSYSTQDDDLEPEEHYDAINIYGIDLSQNSWSRSYSTESAFQSYRGNYELRSAKYDNITIGAYGKRIPIIFAVGNAITYILAYGWIGGLFNSVMPPGGTAKNTIAVANIDSDSDRLPTQTGWGPTDDGRLKPDLVAPGSENSPVYSGDEWNASESIWITDRISGNDTYHGAYGTSYSAPAVSGSVALMIQAYRMTHNNTDPLPSTIKAILIETARDVNATGPDYRTGYGIINVTAAIDLIRSDNMINNVIVEGVILASGQTAYQTDYYSILVPEGQPELKVTLVWDDYPGTINAAKELVNDLDLILIAPNGTVYYPWILDPANPSNNATTGEDHTNNVEQVKITNPAAGKWSVRINGTNVPNPKQRYSLVCNNLDWNIENVDSVEVYWTSIAIDSLTNNPHIAYATSFPDYELKYAYFNGSAWNVQTVDSYGVVVGEGASIALDSLGSPHIAYFNATGLSGHLKYAYKDASGWHIETVDTQGQNRYFASIALDSWDNPHISYLDEVGGPYNDTLKYAYKDASGWHLQTIGTSRGRFNSLALDSSDKPHISYRYYPKMYMALEYAYFDGASWNFDTVENLTGVGWTSIALDSSDEPHIAYHDFWTNKDLKYAYYDGSAWNIKIIDSAGDVGYGCSLGLDAFDYPRISYLDHTNRDLKYAYRDGLMWNNKTVDSTGDVGDRGSIALDASGVPHISYADYTNNKLKYARGGGLTHHYGLIFARYHFETGTFAGWDFSSSTNGTQSGTIYYYGDPAAEWNSNIISGASALSGSYSARLFADFWQHTGAVGPWRVDAAINRTVNRAGASILRATLKFDDIQGSGGIGHSYFGIYVFNALNTSKRVFYGFSTTGDYGDIRYTVNPGELVNFERNIVTDYFNKYGENLPDQIMIRLLSSADYAEGNGERRTTDVIIDDILIVALRDMAITSVTPFKTVVGQGYFMSINITVENQGDFTETFSVTTYAKTNIIQTKTINLTSGDSTTITFTWDTTGFAKGNYTIKAHKGICLACSRRNRHNRQHLHRWHSKGYCSRRR